MKKSNFLFIAMILIIIGFATSSCKKDETTTTTTTTTTTNKFAFMKVGRSWNYKIYDDVGNIQDSVSFLVGKSLGNGLYNMYFDGDSINGDYWFQTDNEFGFGDDPTELIVKANAKVNDVIYNIDNGDTMSFYKVVGLNVSKQVPAGTFLCYKVEEHYPIDGLEGTFYINKDFGIISYDMLDGSVLKLEKKSF